MAVFLLAEQKIIKNDLRRMLVASDNPEFLQMTDDQLEGFFRGLVAWNRGIPLKEIKF